MEITKTAMISVVGRANTGKSTLTNTLVGEKIAITSPKPQTTRTRITGVLERGGIQFVLLDTPGLHKPRSRLGECMVRVVSDTIADVDAALMVVEPTLPIRPAEEELMAKLKSLSMPAVLAVNKIDTVKKESLLAVLAAYGAAHDFAAIVPISAKTGEGTEDLLSELAAFALPGCRLFPEGMTTDQPERRLVAEIIREKMLLLLSDEVPHGVAVDIEKFQENDKGVVEIGATIYCERDSHKGIIIGKKGAMLKKIGEQARAELEAFYGTKVFLETWVKVKDNWRDSLGFIRNMGLSGGEDDRA